jgi:DUF1365 family protein
VNQPQVGFGQVRHQRLRPARNAFAYPTFFLLLPMRSLHAGAATALAHNRAGAISFWDADHGDGRVNALEWLDELLRAEGIADADGEAWLHCYPRMLGYTFKPVSFWYCHRADGSLRAIVVEVNNTFGERHCYLLDGAAWGRELQAAKAFHVSPFCNVEGRYRFRFLITPERERTVVRIDYDDASGALLQTSVSGRLEPATAESLRRALWRHPLMTLAIIARIHWQALRLAAKRVPFFRKPVAPGAFVTRP